MNIPVTADNSSVNGDDAKASWPHLLFNEAIPRNKSLLMLSLDYCKFSEGVYLNWLAGQKLKEQGNRFMKRNEHANDK